MKETLRGNQLRAQGRGCQGEGYSGPGSSCCPPELALGEPPASATLTPAPHVPPACLLPLPTAPEQQSPGAAASAISELTLPGWGDKKQTTKQKNNPQKTQLLQPAPKSRGQSRGALAQPPHPPSLPGCPANMQCQAGTARSALRPLLAPSRRGAAQNF